MKNSRAQVAFVAAMLVVSALRIEAQQPASSPATAGPAAAPATVTLPDLDPAEWFDGKMGGTFGAKTVTAFAKSKRVAIAGFRIVFVTHNEAHAFTRATYLPGGVETGSARAKMEVDLQGVDDATLQAITDRAYQQFVAQLKASGREVITADQMQPSYAGFKLLPPPPWEAKLALFRAKVFSPAGVPLWWQAGDAWGDTGLSQANMRAFNELSKVTQSIAIAPMIVVDFAHMQSSGANRSGFAKRGAEVGAALAMSVSTFTTRVVRAEETRYGGIVFKGDDGALKMTKRLDTDIEFAELHAGSTQKGSVLNFFGADSKSSKSAKVAETTNEAYSAAANAVLSKTVGAFAKLFAANPAK